MEPAAAWQRLAPASSNLQTHPFDLRHPMVAALSAGGHVGKQLEHLVTKTADIHDVVALLYLRRSIRLNIDTHHPSLRAASLKLRPFGHRRGRTTSERTMSR